MPVTRNARPPKYVSLPDDVNELLLVINAGARSAHPQNLRLLQIRNIPYLFDLIELLRKGFDKRD